MPSLRARRIRLRLRRYRPLLVIIFLTTAIWFVMAMSEHRSFPVRVHLQWTGFDAARYVVVSADSLLPLSVVSNGWQELDRSLRSHQQRICYLSASSDTAIATADIFDLVVEQMGFHALHGISSPVDSLYLHLSQRKRKAFAPDISQVEFSFAHHIGLAGPPSVVPDTVYLYGSEASLACIQSIKVAPSAVANISDSNSYLLDLDPVWERFPDIHPSVKQVRITVPTNSFTEKQFSLPVRLVGEDSTRRVRLYPDKVRVTMLVSEKDYPRLTADHLSVGVSLSDNQASELYPRVTKFPSYARVKNIEPAQIQFVLISNSKK